MRQRLQGMLDEDNRWLRQGSDSEPHNLIQGRVDAYKKVLALPELAAMEKLRAEYDEIKEAMEQIREYNSMIPLHTQDPHALHFSEMVNSWSNLDKKTLDSLPDLTNPTNKDDEDE